MATPIRTGNETNKYLIAYFEKNGINVGDEYENYEYQKWIQAKHRKYRELMGMPADVQLDDPNYERFCRFLNNGPDAISEEERQESFKKWKGVGRMIDYLGGGIPKPRGARTH